MIVSGGVEWVGWGRTRNGIKFGTGFGGTQNGVPEYSPIVEERLMILNDFTFALRYDMLNTPDPSDYG
jgi:hypothetical protein